MEEEMLSGKSEQGQGLKIGKIKLDMRMMIDLGLVVLLVALAWSIHESRLDVIQQSRESCREVVIEELKTSCGPCFELQQWQTTQEDFIIDNIIPMEEQKWEKKPKE